MAAYFSQSATYQRRKARPHMHTLHHSQQSACQRERGTVLAAIPETPGTCRSIARAALHIHGLATLADDAATVVTEIASNAVHHVTLASRPPGADTPVIVLVLGWYLRGVRIEVWDQAPGTPRMREPDFETEHGRGLYLVDQITRGRWGYHLSDGSKCVWAECAL